MTNGPDDLSPHRAGSELPPVPPVPAVPPVPPATAPETQSELPVVVPPVTTPEPVYTAPVTQSLPPFSPEAAAAEPVLATEDVPPAPPGERRSRRAKQPKDNEPRSFLKELPILIGIALVLALLLRIFAVQAFYIPSASMEKTLHGCTGCSGDRVLVSKIGYKFHDPRRGDIVVFDGKHTSFPPENIVPPASNGFQSAVRSVQKFLGFGSLGERDYIKRVIAVGGDTIQCCNNGKVVVNGRTLDETYLYEDDQKPFCANPAPGASPLLPQRDAACLGSDAKPFVVPKGYLFVMGDHRGDSQDSRYNGVIPKSSVIGRAFLLVWPLSRLDRFGTPPDFS